MTAHAMAGDEDKSLEAGMNGHVAKPIDPDQLFSTLQKWIKPSEKRAQVKQPEIFAEGPEADQAVPDEEQLPESLPGFDLSAGLKRLQGNKRLYRKLLIDFGAKYKGVAGEIRESLDAKDMNQAHSLVHNLKGLAGNLSAENLLTASVELEKLVKGESKEGTSDEELNQKFAELEEALYQALESVSTLGLADADQAAKPSGEAKVAVPQALAKEAAERIGEAAEMGDVMEIKAVTEALMSKSDAFAPLGKKIIALADDFEFDKIQNVLSELKA
jgi:HPt (histidine-containing phosphotransfer) domain-containing protein